MTEEPPTASLPDDEAAVRRHARRGFRRGLSFPVLRAGYCTAAYASLALAALAFAGNRPLKAAPVWPKEMAHTLLPLIGLLLFGALVFGLLWSEFNNSRATKFATVAGIVAFVLSAGTI
jgi:hypothetical protein